MEIQLPLIDRLLDTHPEVEYHVWNLARNDDDDRWLRSLPPRDGRQMHHELYGASPWARFNDVYRHYAGRQFADATFIKLDDDVVFLDVDRIDTFIREVQQHPDAVLSADVINNGACSTLHPQLRSLPTQLGVPLLDVHKSVEFALKSHAWFFDHVDTAVQQPLTLHPMTDWLSINVIGYSHGMAQRFARDLGTPTPTHIAGRDFLPRQLLGDEGFVNTLPRAVLQGFTACHLTFGPQDKSLTPEQLADLRAGYAAVAEKYLRR